MTSPVSGPVVRGLAVATCDEGDRRSARIDARCAAPARNLRPWPPRLGRRSLRSSRPAQLSPPLEVSRFPGAALMLRGDSASGLAASFVSPVILPPVNKRSMLGKDFAMNTGESGEQK